MLIDRGVTEGEVITIKLTSGEELVAKLVEDGLTFYKLKNPMVIAMGAKGPGLMPYLFTVNPNKEVKLLKAVIAVVESTDEQFAKQFIESTTGIALS